VTTFALYDRARVLSRPVFSRIIFLYVAADAADARLLLAASPTNVDVSVT
jgi:hypothetical protein